MITGGTNFVPMLRMLHFNRQIHTYYHNKICDGGSSKEPFLKVSTQAVCVKCMDSKSFAVFQELFRICPTMPWGEDVVSSVETNANGWITLQGFLAQWT